MYQLVMVLHVISAVCLIVLVLVQQGKGATMGAAFGAGASQTIFGSRGAGSFLLKITLGFMCLFFATSISLNWMSAHAMKKQTQSGSALPLPFRQPATSGLPLQLPPAVPSSAPSVAPASETPISVAPAMPAESAPAVVQPVALPPVNASDMKSAAPSGTLAPAPEQTPVTKKKKRKSSKQLKKQKAIQQQG